MYHYEDLQVEDYSQNSIPEPSDPPLTCAQGHRSSLILQTQEGGCICLLCFSNLISNPNSPTFHVSYALSQLSHAISQPNFLRSLLTFHIHIVIPPLVQSLSSFDDGQIAGQVIELIDELCNAEDPSVFGEFVARISDQLSSGALAWRYRQVYTLHCLGILLNLEKKNPYAYIRDKDAFIHNLVMGLQLPSEEIRGEVLFVLYRVSILQCASKDDEGADILFAYCPKLLHLSLEALMKTQSDDVRLNCIALLKVLAQRGFLENAFWSESSMMDICEADNFMRETDNASHDASIDVLLAEAIKAPLLSPDSQVQIATLDFIFHCLSREGFTGKQVQVLVEQNIVDYIFEILRLSEKKDELVISCLLVLHLFSTVEQVFRQRLAIGFTTLVSVLTHIAQVPFHPVQTEALKLILDGVSNCPGIVSTKHAEEISNALTAMLRRHGGGEMGMFPEAFISTCSIFVALMKSPSSSGKSNLLILVQEASTYAVLASLSIADKDSSQLLHSLILLKEACAFGHEVNSINSVSDTQTSNWALGLCQKNLLPWFMEVVNEMEEDSILGVLETFYFLLGESRDNQGLEFTKKFLSLSWFHLSFGCLGLHPTDKMKQSVYLIFSSIMDCLYGHGSGETIRDAASALPTDPIDMLFLLGQKGNHSQQLFSCQTAVLQILHISSLSNEMIADNKLVLSSLEQYILVNGSDLLYGNDLMPVIPLVNLYALHRGLPKMSYQMSYSPEPETIFFQLVIEKDLDLFSDEFHPTSLKWLFQQERISKALSFQILQFCRKSCSISSQNIDLGNTQYRDGRDIAELVSKGDNLAPKLLVILLKQLLEEKESEHDIILVLNLISFIINILPAASDQLCINGLGNAAHSLCHSLILSSSTENRTIISRFIFIVLSSAQTETLLDDGAWLSVIMKLLDFLTCTETQTEWTDEDLFVIGVLSLVLHYSTHDALVESSKFILLNSSLASMIRNAIDVSYTDGSALIYQDEETHVVKTLVFLLLLNYFYLRSLQAVLPGSVDWQDFLTTSDTIPPFPSMGLVCQDFCRFMHFGSPLVKLIASYCLVEMLTRITDQANKQQNDLNCTMGYLRNVVAVLEGLVFHSDIRVALNSGLCLSTLLSWDVCGLHNTGFIGTENWCRMIVEELAMSLSAPCSLSKSFMMHHKPAVQVAAALLNLNRIPGWMRSLFNESCISGIIENLSPNNVTAEVVLLFRELLHLRFLKPDQIASINHVFQACRKRIYMDNRQDESEGKQTRKVFPVSGGLDDVCEFLVHLVSSDSFLYTTSSKPQVGSRLSTELELFFRSLTEDKDV